MSEDISAEEKQQLSDIMKSAADSSAQYLIDKITDKDAFQRLLRPEGNLARFIAEKCLELSRGRYAGEEVASNYGYYSGYTKPRPASDQIDILRSHWPQLNPDPVIKYMRDVYLRLQLPNWVEGAFVIIRRGYFSDQYGEEVVELFKALSKDRKGKFYNDYEGRMGPEYLRQNEATLAMLARLMEQQPDSDLLMLPAQFGIRFRGRSVRRVREIYTNGEFGLGTKDSGTMLLTHDNRLRATRDLSVDLAGDKISPHADGVFSRAPYFSFHDGKVKFLAGVVGCANVRCGSASVFAL